MATNFALDSRRSANQVEIQRPIAVSHIITTLSTGGAEMMLYRLLRVMDRSRFRNSVVALGGDGAIARRIRDAGIPVRTLGLRPSQALRGMARLVRVLRRERPDVIQTWMYHADLLGGLASLSLRCAPLAWNIRCGGLDRSIDKPGTLWISRACAALSPVLPARIISCSHSGAEVHAAAGYSRRKIHVIPNGFDLQEYRPDRASYFGVRNELGLPQRTLLIGSVGRYDRAKDHATLIEAAATIIREHAGLNLAICGEGTTPANSELTARLRAAGIDGRCHLLGRREDIPRILAALDVFVSASAVEGFPNAIGEAMACGVPCVVTDAGDSRRLVGETGLVAPVRNAAALAAGLRQLIELGRDGRTALGAMARRRVGECFGIVAVARQYEDLYREMAAVCAA
jgi:glycosyltransferase involved in cell wall biosynthesis